MAQAGVRIESQIALKSGKQFANVLELQENRAFRVQHPGRHDPGGAINSTIYDGERIIKLRSTTLKTYTVMTMADLKAQIDRLEQMERSMPPLAREHLDEARMVPVFTFKRVPGGLRPSPGSAATTMR